ncbi:MAG: hypothetical protein GY765_27955 [bacterium]|nr:hypothetical protein [bacterium]
MWPLFFKLELLPRRQGIPASRGKAEQREAVWLIVARGRLPAQTEPGVMLNVPLPQKELLSLLPENLCLAVNNGSTRNVQPATSFSERQQSLE